MTLEDDLTTAAATGNTADVENLLRAGAEVNGPNCFGRTALQVSVTRCAETKQVYTQESVIRDIINLFR